MTSGKYECNVYNRMAVLSYDIENELDRIDPEHQHVIKKLFYYFNKSTIDGKFAKPYLIKFFLTEPQDEEIMWGVNDIFKHFQRMPKYQLQANILCDYNYIDIFNKQFPIKNKETIAKFSSYEDEAYDFEVNLGSVIVSQDVKEHICQILTDHEIFYQFDNDDEPAYIEVYSPHESKYIIKISLNGKIDKRNPYEIAPNIVEYKPYISLGKFNTFNGKPTAIPNEDNLAIIAKCPHCQKYMIYNWWAINGTKCPYCNTNNKIYI